jgi:hypothetical protein
MTREEYLEDEQGIEVNFNKTQAGNVNELFYQIEKRQTNRSVYQGKIIPHDTVRELGNIILEPNIRKYIVQIGESLADSLTQYIMKGNEIQMNDKAFKGELVTWMRFNRGEIDRTNDELSYKALGFPAIPLTDGKQCNFALEQQAVMNTICPTIFFLRIKKIFYLCALIDKTNDDRNSRKYRHNPCGTPFSRLFCRRFGAISAVRTFGKRFAGLQTSFRALRNYFQGHQTSFRALRHNVHVFSHS